MVGAIIFLFLCVFSLGFAIICTKKSEVQAEELKRKEEQKRIREEAKETQRKKKLLKEFRISYVKNITDIVKEYQEILLLKKAQGCYENEWGELVADDYLKELDYFILRIIPSKYDYTQTFEYQRLEEFDMIEREIFSFELVLSKEKPAEYKGFDGKKINVNFGYNIKGSDILLYNQIEATENIIDEYLSKIALVDFIVNPKKHKKGKPKTPLDYEKHISLKLKDLGFNAHATKGSGDQGVDVLADKNGVKFAIQCKMYSNPVGNKAVQEINAGRDYYNCDYAVVVTNSTYTKSARSAANACNVILLHETELEKLLELTKNK